MSFPPIYTTLIASSALTAIVGQRIYMDNAPQGVAKPYVTWTYVGGRTSPFLGDVPGIDNQVCMFDIWSENATQRDAIYAAMIAVLDPVANMLAQPMSGWEFETKLFRLTFDYSFWRAR